MQFLSHLCMTKEMARCCENEVPSYSLVITRDRHNGDKETPLSRISFLFNIWGNRGHAWTEPSSTPGQAKLIAQYSLDHCLHTHAVRKGQESGNSGKYPRWLGWGERGRWRNGREAEFVTYLHKLKPFTFRSFHLVR